MRQVSGSAVQGLEVAALRPARLPGPRGFSLLNQLILDPGEREGFKDARMTRRGGGGVGRKQTVRRINGDREGGDAEGGAEEEKGGERGGDPKREMEGRKIGCKRVVTASHLERV